MCESGEMVVKKDVENEDEDIGFDSERLEQGHVLTHTVRVTREKKKI